MNGERLFERTLGTVVEQYPCLGWSELEVLRGPSASSRTAADG
jgi:hypothetical protein